MQGRVARELYPTRVVVAGCSLAMALTKVFYIRPFDTYVARAPPGVLLDAYVDDVTLSMTGDGRTVTIHLTRAHESIAALVRDDLGCELAKEKTAVVATTKELASSISRAIGIKTQTADAQCMLGVDNIAGAQRAKLRRRSKKAARLKAAIQRRRRLAQVRGAAGRKANKVFRTGLLPSAAYDAPVWGIDCDEALRLRRLAATAMAPRARGLSLTATHMWYGHPTADAESSPVVQYARMVWKAVTEQKDARDRGTSLADIRGMWESAEKYFGPVVRTLRTAREEDLEVPLKMTRAAWSSLRGPIGAAALTLERVGWTFVSPFVIQDERGATYMMTSTSPALVRDLMRHAVRRADERLLAAKWAKREPCDAGRRACLDLAIHYSRPGRCFNPKQAGAFKAAVCGALMTADRARRLGGDADGLCPLCKAARDTLRHRVHGCARTETVVCAALPRWCWEKAQRAAATDSFWTSAAFPHLADVAAPPTRERVVHVEVFPDVEQSSEAAMAIARECGFGGGHEVDGRTANQKARLGGRVYFDGSCTPSPIRDLARAGCSIVEVNDDGDPIRTIEATVPWDLPQTAQCAENLAMAMGFDYVWRQAAFVGDCPNVVKAMNGTSRRALASTSRYAGLVLATHAHPERRRLVSEIRWTKAHRVATGNEERHEARDIKANGIADDLAKAAVKMHPPLGPLTDSLVEYYTRRAPHVVRAVVAALELFPPAPKDLPRVPKPANEQQARLRNQHNWQYRAGAWRCTICRDWLNARRLPAYRRHQRCSGRTVDDEAASIVARGHRLCKAASTLPFVICSGCGSWGNRRSRGLVASCAPPTHPRRRGSRRLGGPRANGIRCCARALVDAICPETAPSSPTSSAPAAGRGSQCTTGPMEWTTMPTW